MKRWRPHTGISKTKHVLVSSCADGNVSHWHVPSGNEGNSFKLRL